MNNKPKRQEVEEPQKCEDALCSHRSFDKPLKCRLRSEFSKKDPIIAEAYCPKAQCEAENHKGVVIKYRVWGLGGERIVRVFKDGKVELFESGGLGKETQQFRLSAFQVTQLVKGMIDNEFLELPESPNFSTCFDGWSGFLILNHERGSKKVESKNTTYVPDWFKMMTAEIEKLIQDKQRI